MDKQEKDRITIYVPEKLKWDAKKLAADQHMSVTELLVELLEREMQRAGSKQPQRVQVGQ